MTNEVSNGHVTYDVACCEAVRSAILATAWLLVSSVLLSLTVYTVCVCVLLRHNK